MGPIQRVIVKASLRSVRNPWTTLIIALVALVLCVYLGLTRLAISSDQDELFSDSELYFRDYLRFGKQFPENEAIYIVLRPRDPHARIPLDRWIAAVDAVVANVQPLSQYVERVEYRAPGSKLGVYGALFDDPPSVRTNRKEIDEFGDLARVIGEKPGLDALALGTSSAERFFRSMYLSPPKDFARSSGLVAEISRSLLLSVEGGAGQAKPTPPDLARIDGTPRDLGFFYEKDQLDSRLPDEQARHLLLIRIHEKSDYASFSSLTDAVDAIGIAANKAITPGAFPEFSVVLTGRPVLDADEMRTSEHDTRISEIIAGIAVFVGLILFLMPWSELRHAESWSHSFITFLRGLWLALVAEIALGFAIGWTFGWATLTVGRLNLLSLVFVIALIGIGMDYLIQILTRYRREAQRYERATAVWARVYRYVSPPVSTACLGAAGAFLVSVLTPFRGAAELGIIAGGGLLLCLLSGYTVLPAILTLFPPGLRLKDASERYATVAPAAGGWRLLLPAAWIVALLCLAIPMTWVSFDPNLINLQAANLESVETVNHLETWYAVALSNDLATLRKVRGSFEGSPYVGRTDSLLDREDNAAFLADHAAKLPKVKWAEPQPLTEDHIAALARILGDLAARYDKLPAPNDEDAHAAAATTRALAARLAQLPPKDAAALITAWQPQFVNTLKEALALFAPPPLDLAKIPSEVRDHYVNYSDPGHPIYALYIYPKDDLWDQSNLAAFVTHIESRTAPLLTGKPPANAIAPDTRNFILTGLAPELYHTTGAIRSSFFWATLYALILIFILVLVDLRSIPHTLIAISVLALGLPMLLAVMGGLSQVLGTHAYLVRFNLANFFGLPILIGAGHEYGVFMVHRYKETLHNPRRLWRPWDVSDRALLLCAYVTCLSFAFLLLGRHRGMQSLGFVMAAGTACIYLATIFVVRPLLLWRLKQKDVSR